MNATATVVIIFIALVLSLGLMRYQEAAGVPIVRAGIPATWAMYPSKEGFQNEGSLEPIKRTLEQWLPAPEALVKKSDCDTNAPAPYKSEGKNPSSSYTLLDGWLKPVVAPCPVGPTAQQCWNKDYTRSLERAGSFAQRTNNYQHGNAESCTALNHDLILDFYKPVTSEGAFQV